VKERRKKPVTGKLQLKFLGKEGQRGKEKELREGNSSGKES